MVLDPAARLTAKKALQHPWVQVILVTYLHIDERIVEIPWEENIIYTLCKTSFMVALQGQGARREDLCNARDKLKLFNARRKMKGGMLGVMAATDWGSKATKMT